MSLPKIYNHALTTPSSSPENSPQIIPQALALLRPHLPTSLPLYRRLQFGRFFPATTLLTNLPDLDEVPSSSSSSPPWILAFVDRTCRPETEVWIYGSWEDENGNEDGDGDGEKEREEELQKQTALVISLAREIMGMPLPESIHADVIPGLGKGKRSTGGGHDDEGEEERDTAGITRAAYGGHAADPNVVLCGAVHRASLPALQKSGLVTERFKVGIVDNHTYVFDVDRLPEARALPEELRWGKLRAENFALVRARTQIPRLDRTLGVLPNTAVFDEAGTAVAWAFVGLDGSLTSLHVEPQWRGKGIAKAVTKRLFENEMGAFWEDGGKRLAHGYVQVGNEASCRVCDSLGGKSNWEVAWVRLDLGIQCS